MTTLEKSKFAKLLNDIGFRKVGHAFTMNTSKAYRAGILQEAKLLVSSYSSEYEIRDYDFMIDIIPVN
jgi:hypothetical protein